MTALSGSQYKPPALPEVYDYTIKSMLKMLRRLIGEDIELIWSPGKELWTIKIDPSQVDQILANLCVNARDAITDVGKVTIKTENIYLDKEYCDTQKEFLPGQYVLLTVNDNGSGMEIEIQNKIFEPFYTTKSVGHGTGLGLSTVYGIVRQNSGFISVDSMPGEGTTFKIYLPRNDEQAVNVNFENRVKAGSGNRETILFVEDDISILRLGKKILEGLNYTVFTSASPAEAIEIAKRYDGEIDLLITDVIMPEMNGRDLAGQMLASYPELRVLFMSGYTADIIACRGVLEQDLNFIQKPFSIKDLSYKVQEVLNYSKSHKKS